MNKPKLSEVKLPYASTVASFFGDQGAVQGSSFLGRMFKGNARNIQSQIQPGPVTKPYTVDTSKADRK